MSMANDLVVRKIQLPQSQLSLRAAMYVRVSTDYQRYSIENQTLVLEAYAASHGLQVVHTYRDQGESGLGLRNRQGLRDLLDDARNRRADFSHLLVYDVTRWGRFQDTDESAHHEFVCKQAGIKVAYCAEQFENDGSLLSSIIKNLKRVMAAEYSRELSAKVYAGACSVARLGFRTGATPGYGLRRELVGADGKSKGILIIGQRKNLQTDHILLRRGPAHELRIVRRIFRQFALDRIPIEQIARELNQEGVPNHRSKPWTRHMVQYLLQNENYIGNIVYNRKSFKLRQVMKQNPEESWIRSKAGFAPIVSVRLFARAQLRLTEHYVRRSDEQLLECLRDVVKEKGRLTCAAMIQMPGVPSPALYAWRFGSVRNAFKLIGHAPARNCEYFDSRPALTAKLLEIAADVSRRIRALGASAQFDAKTHTLIVDSCLNVSFRIARYYPAHDKVAVWHVHRRKILPPGWILALRLNKENTGIIDYFLIPTTEMRKIRVALRETLRYSRFDKYHAPSIKSAVRKIMEAVAAANQVSLTTAAPKKLQRPGQTKKATGPALH
jgi:DNA invertase Pin-like site-specific DNA recombinase